MTAIKPHHKKRPWLKRVLLGLVIVIVLWIALLVRDALAVRCLPL